MRVLTIGRSSENDIAIDDGKVSRHHLQIIQDDAGNFRLADFGSTNGTYINGVKIKGEVRLSPNDIVKIGNTVLPWKSYFQPAPPLSNRGTIESPIQTMPRERHGFITFWLVLMIIGGVFSPISAAVQYSGGLYTTSMLVVAILSGLCAIASAIMLFNWMKVGFWLQIGGSVIFGGLSIYLLSGFAPMLGIDMGALIGIQIGGIVLGSVILWAILQIKKNGVKFWDNLE